MRSLKKTGLKKYRWHLLPQLLLATIVATILAAGTTQTSQAASPTPQTNTNCTSPGTLVQTIPITAGTTTIGNVEIYYNSSTGYNCVYTKALGPAYGPAKLMTIAIDSCTQTNPGSTCTPYQHDYDQGNFKYYAGAAALKAPGRCINVYGSIFWEEASRWGITSGASHCGS